MKRLTCLVLACLLALSLAACGAPETETLDIFAMDTYMSLVAIGDGGAEVLQACSARINALEQKLSRTIETSDVSRLNAEGSAQLSEDTAALLRAALDYSEATGGAFDVTVAPLVALWGITTDSPRVPSQEEIDALLPLVGSEHVRLSGAAAALDGQHPSENAVLVCKEIGVDISGHIARRFTPEEIDVWDVYFTMSKTHAYILMQAGVPAEKIYVPHYIDDPYGGDLNTYRKCRDKICEELQTFEQHLGF